MNKILICTYDENLLPIRGTPGSVCWDLKCTEDFSIEPGKILKV